MPKVSLIVSAFNRPEFLRCCLASLVCQTFTDWEALVMDNATDRNHRFKHQNYVLNADSLKRIQYQPSWCVDKAKISCYYSAEFGVSLAKGEWIAFPSDDSYYTPHWLEKLLAHEHEGDLIYSDMVMTTWHNAWVMDVAPRECHIDKTGFLLRKTKFEPFPRKMPDGSASNSDGLLIDLLMKKGIKSVKVPGPLAVHN